MTVEAPELKETEGLSQKEVSAACNERRTLINDSLLREYRVIWHHTWARSAREGRREGSSGRHKRRTTSEEVALSISRAS